MKSKLRRHSPNVRVKSFTWEQWVQKWYLTTAHHELLNLLDIGFSVVLPENPRMQGQVNRLDHPDALTARYRSYLHIADCSSGYSAEIRRKAMEMLFGGKHMQFAGLFPYERAIDRKTLNTLFWFLRPKHPNKLNCYDNFTNYDALDAANKLTDGKFWGNLEACMDELWRGWLNFNNHCNYSCGGIKLTSETHRLIALRVLLHRKNADFIKHEIWRGVRRGSKERECDYRHVPDGCIATKDIDVMEERLARYCTPNALQMIETTLTSGPLGRKPLFDDALSTEDTSALFLRWVEEFRDTILPAERVKTETALAERTQRLREQERKRLESERARTEQKLKTLSQHDD